MLLKMYLHFQYVLKWTLSLKIMFKIVCNDVLEKNQSHFLSWIILM